MHSRTHGDIIPAAPAIVVDSKEEIAQRLTEFAKEVDIITSSGQNKPGMVLVISFLVGPYLFALYKMLNEYLHPEKRDTSSSIVSTPSAALDHSKGALFTMIPLGICILGISIFLAYLTWKRKIPSNEVTNKFFIDINEFTHGMNVNHFSHDEKCVYEELCRQIRKLGEAINSNNTNTYASTLEKIVRESKMLETRITQSKSTLFTSPTETTPLLSQSSSSSSNYNYTNTP